MRTSEQWEAVIAEVKAIEDAENERYERQMREAEEEEARAEAFTDAALYSGIFHHGLEGLRNLPLENLRGWLKAVYRKAREAGNP